MKHFEKLYVMEDSDCEDYPKSKPLVKVNVIRLAVFCVVVVMIVGGIIGWLMQ